MFRNFYLKSFLILTVLFLPALAPAQNPVSWSLESDVRGRTVKKDESFKAKLRAAIDGEWHLYAVEQPEGGPFPTRISIPENTPFKLNGSPESPNAISKTDPNFKDANDKPLETKFFRKQAEFNVPLAALTDANTEDLAVNIKYQVCNDSLCLPPKTVKVTFAGFEDVKKSTLADTGGQQQQSTVVSQPAEQ